MLVYRIILKKFSQSLVAPGLAGRWNRTGQQVIYSAESIPLAFMENMIRRKGLGFNDSFRIMMIDIPDQLKITEIAIPDLKSGWRAPDDYSICQNASDDWYTRQLSPVLKVPSAVLATDNNYVINAQHADFNKIRIEAITDFVPDERIEEILKNYHPKHR